MASGKVLIVGAGVAGSINAFWLARHGYDVTVIERSPASQKLGQGLEIEQPALKVVAAMGILDQLHAFRTAERGAAIEDEHSRAWASFGIGDQNGRSFTGELELMRGDLTDVLCKTAAALPNVTYRFETTLDSLSQTPSAVTVTLATRAADKSRSTTEEASYDFVVAADGARSATRALLMGAPEELGCYHPIGAYVAYFSIPRLPRDWPLSRACNFPGGRMGWLRPTRADSAVTSAYLMHMPAAGTTGPAALHDAIKRGDRPAQRRETAKLYGDIASWEMPRLVESVLAADNFYADALEQVKLDTWSKGRVVLLGDSAWAPTPFTGQGNQLAIIGAWVLAQELGRAKGSSSSPEEAFAQYEARFRPYVTEMQQVPLGGRAPRLALPQTRWGIALLRCFMVVVSWVARAAKWVDASGVTKLFGSGEAVKDAFDLQMDDAAAVSDMAMSDPAKKAQ